MYVHNDKNLLTKYDFEQSSVKYVFFTIFVVIST